MGSLQSYFTRPDPYVAMLGYENSGKTVILYQLKLGAFSETLPSFGYNSERIIHDGFSINIWDVCGRYMHGFQWRFYLDNAAGLIFVVDSDSNTGNKERLRRAKDSLWGILHEIDGLEMQAPLLVYANKQDLDSSMMVAEIRDALDLKSIKTREWHIQGTSALMNEGLREGLDWLVAQLRGTVK
ncbi:Arf GTPase arf1 [Mortierella sp. NVP85]|nr:Arf GTPase arf1 [Mortierella sp. NVP85]